MDVEAEIRDLKRRVSEIEGSSGFLIEQIRGVHKDLLAFQARTEQRFDQLDGRFDKLEGRGDRVEGRLDRVEGRLGRVEGRLDGVERGLNGLREDLPGIVGDAMRAVLRESRKKSRTRQS
jgi:predicted  nucleic acid-binding Zn-ribbon protein